jgi:hypothetical protein
MTPMATESPNGVGIDAMGRVVEGATIVNEVN